MTEAFLGLGSNLGDKQGHIRAAARQLEASPQVGVVKLSPLYRSEPVGKLDQDWFVNAVARVETTLLPDGLLALCQSIEVEQKRVRGERWGPRTLDIDILFYGRSERKEAGLEIPHPRLWEREFVLRPLLDLAPGFTWGERPLSGVLAALDPQGVERIED